MTLFKRPATPDSAHHGAPEPFLLRAIARLALLAALTSPQVSLASALPQVKDGDIIFHTSRSAQSMAIQRATGSRYSHMGLILMREGKPFVFEAVATVRYTPLDKWLARGQGGHYVIKRLAQADRMLSPKAIARLRGEAAHFKGKPYDLTFEWSDQRIYCSELVWKIYKQALDVKIGHLQRLKDFHLDDPVVRQKLRERYGSQVPLEEPVISPAAMFDSPLLVTVRQR